MKASGSCGETTGDSEGRKQKHRNPQLSFKAQLLPQAGGVRRKSNAGETARLEHYDHDDDDDDRGPF